MSIKTRSVRVHQVPEEVTPTKEFTFLRDMQNFADMQRPRVVLDCSKVRKMDKPTMHLLLSCLEQAMKRNGDVRLASVRPEVELALEASGMNRLFEIYATPEGAANSFHHRPMSAAPRATEAKATVHDAEHAA